MVANVQDHPTLCEVATAHDSGVLDRVIQAAGEHALEATAALFSAAGLAFDLGDLRPLREHLASHGVEAQCSVRTLRELPFIERQLRPMTVPALMSH